MPDGSAEKRARQRANKLKPSASSSQTSTHVAFRDFIKLADITTINCFLATATSTLESENLEALWKRAYEEGYDNGRKAMLLNLGVKLEEKFEEGVRRGMDLGREEGYTVAKQGFDGIVKKLKDREDSKKVSTSNSSTQTEPTSTTANVFTQTERTGCAEPEYVSPPVADISPAQNHSEMPVSNQKHLEPPKAPVSESFSWADDAKSLPTLSISPMKLPRDLSCLRSSSTNPFSSICRRHRNRKNTPRFTKFQPQHNIQYTPSNLHYHIPAPRRRPHPHFSASLNWDSDPRLSDLSRSLQALGWIRAH